MAFRHRSFYCFNGSPNAENGDKTAFPHRDEGAAPDSNASCSSSSSCRLEGEEEEEISSVMENNSSARTSVESPFIDTVARPSYTHGVPILRSFENPTATYFDGAPTTRRGSGISAGAMTRSGATLTSSTTLPGDALSPYSSSRHWSSSSSSSCSSNPGDKTFRFRGIAPHHDPRVAHFLSGVASGDSLLPLVFTLRKQQQQEQKHKQRDGMHHLADSQSSSSSSSSLCAAPEDHLRCGSSPRPSSSFQPVPPPSFVVPKDRTNTTREQVREKRFMESKAVELKHPGTNHMQMSSFDAARCQNALGGDSNEDATAALIQAALLLSVEDPQANEEATRLFVSSREMQDILLHHYWLDDGHRQQQSLPPNTQSSPSQRASLLISSGKGNESAVLFSSPSSSCTTSTNIHAPSSLPPLPQPRPLQLFPFPCLPSLLSPLVVSQVVRSKLRRGECNWVEALGWLRDTATLTPVVAATCIDVCKKVGHWSIALECLAAIPLREWTEMDVSGTIQSLYEASRRWRSEGTTRHGFTTTTTTNSLASSSSIVESHPPSHEVGEEEQERLHGKKIVGEDKGETSAIDLDGRVAVDRTLQEPKQPSSSAIGSAVMKTEDKQRNNNNSNNNSYHSNSGSGEIPVRDTHYHNRMVFACQMATKILCFASQHVRWWSSAAALNNTLGLFAHVGASQWLLACAVLDCTLHHAEDAHKVEEKNSCYDYPSLSLNSHPKRVKCDEEQHMSETGLENAALEYGNATANEPVQGAKLVEEKEVMIEAGEEWNAFLLGDRYPCGGSISTSSSQTLTSRPSRSSWGADERCTHDHHHHHHHQQQVYGNDHGSASATSSLIPPLEALVQQVRATCRPLKGLQANPLTLFQVSQIFQTQWAVGLAYAHWLIAAPNHRVPIGGDLPTIEMLLQLCIRGQRQREALYFMEQRNLYLSSRSAHDTTKSSTKKRSSASSGGTKESTGFRAMPTDTTIRPSLQEPLARLLCQMQAPPSSSTAPCGANPSSSLSASAIYSGEYEYSPLYHSFSSSRTAPLVSPASLSKHFNPNTLSRAYNTLIQQSKTVREATLYCDALQQKPVRGGIENESLAHLVNLYAREGHWEKALKALRELAIDDPRRHARFVPTAALHDAVQYALEQAPSPGASWEVSVKLFTDMTGRRHVPLSDVAFQCVIKKCFSQGASAQAQKLFEYLIRHGVK